MKIAVLEDDESQAKVISIYLESANHEFIVCGTGKDFMASVEAQNYNLFILDWELPDTTGIEILKWVRNTKGWGIPVLFMTVRDSKQDIVTALENGADDYMTKPADRQEFLARINTLIRRHNFTEKLSDTSEYGHFIINQKERKISNKGKQLTLTPKEYELASLLFSSEGRLLPRTEILKTVWGLNSEINTRTVDTHISRLRKKLELEPTNGWHLTSIYHHGYRLERVEL